MLREENMHLIEKVKEDKTSPFYAPYSISTFLEREKSVSSMTLLLPSCTPNIHGAKKMPIVFGEPECSGLANRHHEVSAGLCLCTAPYPPGQWQISLEHLIKRSTAPSHSSALCHSHALLTETAAILGQRNSILESI